MHEAVFEDRFLEHAGALGLAQKAHQLSLHVCRKAGERSGREICRFQRPIGADCDAFLVFFDLYTNALERMDGRCHVVSVCTFEPDLPSGYRGSTGVRARFDPVGHDLVGGTVQALHTVNGQIGGADPFDLGSHRGQQVA